ncbi:TVP38/TMEM64 family protein [Bacillus suaedaesalsae]|uniref:TVP38/TMEM64 family membrane protein n=1 Tax=Bacillus suaedaesalsae TaxID=2810349 RepID=A0ABS2DGY0_9BACI|nr:VTT domain-containing protein [Bacillus suaedaesalsae]MBM6617735.1 TVP38/TMEM64 family protein [Bacillus suaedaesalsae]
MTEWLIHLFESNIPFALLLSILLNVIISILAVVPSVFITAANIAVFGFWEGTLLSLAGEVLGSVISFQLYRLGFTKLRSQNWDSNHIEKLRHVQGVQAFIIILSMRLLPFVPSGLVTLGAAFGTVSLPTFAIATLIGKIPAILMEAYSVHTYLNWENEAKVWLTVIGILLIGMYLLFKKMK